MKIENHFFSFEEGEGFSFRKAISPNTRAQTSQKYFVIHATEGSTVNGAVSTLNDRKLSVHFVLGKDGKEVVQMVPFNKGAIHAVEYNSNSVGVELDYPGDLSETGSSYNSLSRFKEDEYIYASAYNDSRFKYWALYPGAQLDALLAISKTLVTSYGITDVVGHEELHSYKMDPGPAFPITQFREQLLGVNDRSLVLQETTREVALLNKPGGSCALYSGAAIPAATPVSIINQSNNWYLVSVVAEANGNPWMMGWVEKSAIQAKPYKLSIRSDHYLATQEGRVFEVKEPDPKNYGRTQSMEAFKYIVVHITTGTRMESTIAQFRNPTSGVSSHLLVGRDGRVVQFVPFNKVAFHAGFSWWEGDRNLNRYAIGIELDNAGFLEKGEQGWLRKETVIPEDLVKVARHWRESKDRGWEDFPEIQMQVALEIAKELIKQYPSITEILGHDQVNLRYRVDPGPLFPMERFRQELFGRSDPKIVEFEIAQDDTDLYTNVDGKVPNTNPARYDEVLAMKSIVKIDRFEDEWAFIQVQKSHPIQTGRTGWVKRKSIQPTQNGEKNITTEDQDFFKKAANPPTSKLWAGPFPKGTRVRIQEVDDDWTLVALTGAFKGMQGLEGWIQSELLDPIQ